MRRQPWPLADGYFLLLTVACAFFAAVNGNFTMPNHLGSNDIACLNECQFLEDNQTIIIIHITDPKIGVEGVASYTTPIRMKDPATRKVAPASPSVKRAAGWYEGYLGSLSLRSRLGSSGGLGGAGLVRLALSGLCQGCHGNGRADTSVHPSRLIRLLSIH